jgi:hypothetical protein
MHIHRKAILSTGSFCKSILKIPEFLFKISAILTNLLYFSNRAFTLKLHSYLKQRIYLIIIVLQFISLPLRAQEDITRKYDTIVVSEGSTIITGGEKYTVHTDTFFILPHGTKYKLRLSRQSRSENFFDSLEVRASQRKWTTKLHNIVITAPKKEDIIDTIQTSESVSPFLEYGGKTIRDIRIRTLQPFGPTIHDTSRAATNSLERFGNNVHSQTREKVILNHLLIREGDPLNPSIISDNERLIRQLPYIEDARIYIIEPPEAPGTVDILLVVKDAFSIGMGGNIKDWDAGNLEIFDNNLAGQGHQIHTLLHWNAEKSPWLGYEFFYIINNIGRSFISSKARYAHIFEKETYELAFDRKFLTPSIKYAGSLNLERTHNKYNINYNDTLILPTDVKYNLFDAWLGRSFALTSVRRYTPNRINLILGTRLRTKHYFQRPEVSENTFYEYHNKTLWLSTISFSQQRFFRSNLIYSFGRTEDIAQGTLLSVILGPEIGEYNRRFYEGISFSRGNLLANLGYLYLKAEFGGFTENGFFPDQGVLNLEANYFTNLFIVHRFKFRHFINLNYVKGYNRFSDEYIDLNDQNGIRGFNNELIKGTRKATMNFETVAFSPYYFYGFRFAFFGFIDLGLISYTQPLLETTLHRGFGIGVRIRNERLVFETFSVRIGYYPTLEDEQFPFVIDVSGEKKFDSQDFYVNKPDLIWFD